MAQLSSCRRQTFTYADHLPPRSSVSPSEAVEKLHRDLSSGPDLRIIFDRRAAAKTLNLSFDFNVNQTAKFCNRTTHIYAHTRSIAGWRAFYIINYNEH